MPSPSVLVLVLNYNAGPALEACLTSLLRTNYSNVRIVVLDNGSTDCSAQIPDRLGITVHRFGENLLYCGAYNRALRAMRGDADFVLICRNVIEEVGLLDEAFAINFEDVDMQLRARRYGYRSAIAGEAEIPHD